MTRLAHAAARATATAYFWPPGSRGHVRQADHPKIGTKFIIITNANLNTAASQAAIYKTSC